MSYEFDSEKIKIDGYTLAIKYSYDEDCDAPWDNEDCHGPVRKSRNPHNEYKSDKRPGERPLNCATSREIQFYYDWQAAMQAAKTEGWNTEPFDAPNKAARAVQADYEYLRGFVNNDWIYCFIEVALLDDQGEELATDSIGWIETYKSYHKEHAQEMAESMVKTHKKETAESERQERIYSRYSDAMSLGIVY